MAKSERVTVEWDAKNKGWRVLVDGEMLYGIMENRLAYKVAATLNAALEKTAANERKRCQQILAEGPVDQPQIDNTGEWQKGLHCGVEDRDINDFYDACDYGFESGVERALEWARGALEAEVPDGET